MTSKEAPLEGSLEVTLLLEKWERVEESEAEEDVVIRVKSSHPLSLHHPSVGFHIKCGQLLIGVVSLGSQG